MTDDIGEGLADLRAKQRTLHSRRTTILDETGSGSRYMQAKDLHSALVAFRDRATRALGEQVAAHDLSNIGETFLRDIDARRSKVIEALLGIDTWGELRSKDSAIGERLVEACRPVFEKWIDEAVAEWKEKVEADPKNRIRKIIKEAVWNGLVSWEAAKAAEAAGAELGKQMTAVVTSELQQEWQKVMAEAAPTPQGEQ
jgi:hypothetical protein